LALHDSIGAHRAPDSINTVLERAAELQLLDRLGAAAQKILAAT